MYENISYFETCLNKILAENLAICGKLRFLRHQSNQILKSAHNFVQIWLFWANATCLPQLISIHFLSFQGSWKVSCRRICIFLTYTWLVFLLSKHEKRDICVTLHVNLFGLIMSDSSHCDF